MTKDQAIALATLELKLVSVNGYECETTYEAVTPDQWGDVVRVLEGLAQPQVPDCRTCVNKPYCLTDAICKPDCTNGDQYQPAPKVVLWRTE